MNKPVKGKKPSKTELIKLYTRQFLSIREVAEAVECSKDMVYRSLQEYGIQIRTNKRRSKLTKYKLSALEKEVRAKGIRGYAREIGVDESTLRHHLKVRKEPK